MTAVNYLWNPLNDNIVEEFDDAGSTVAEYTTERDQFGNVVSQYRDNQESFYHFDGIGSMLALTWPDGNVSDTRSYSAFGDTTEQSGNTYCPFQFIGQKQYYQDTVASTSVRRRELTNEHARWFSIDPAWTFQTPQAYVFVANNPLQAIDPSGMSLCVPDPAPCPQQHKDIAWYGCFCGLGNPPAEAPKRGPIDPVDNACVDHDNCYVANACAPGRIGIGIIFDPRPGCVQCDRAFCRALRIATCNRYPPGSESERNCIRYRIAAMTLFNCEGRFRIPLPTIPE